MNPKMPDWLRLDPRETPTMLIAGKTIADRGPPGAQRHGG